VGEGPDLILIPRLRSQASSKKKQIREAGSHDQRISRRRTGELYPDHLDHAYSGSRRWVVRESRSLRGGGGRGLERESENVCRPSRLELEDSTAISGVVRVVVGDG